MDKLLSGLTATIDQENTIPQRSSRKAVKVDYVRVLCDDGGTVITEQNNELSEQNPDDDLIWWSWDGKLEGFSDW